MILTRRPLLPYLSITEEPTLVQQNEGLGLVILSTT
jgi:hypothetical protein